ncbi:methylmalonyl Co-A mutase-associated GTPase MeaB [Candidatus Poriferisodalis sp.]|uniref:methylmalonyl Co-A mutase-associated GTPase MeaB n=1 Tax=Candidatus Poriferisodalis sp. TaxID=3101277 RepID=UPI003B024D53
MLPMAEVDVAELAAGVRACDRAAIGRAITLVESRLADDAEPAQELLAELLTDTGGAHRVGITGVPGVGKSTLIETLGTALTEQGHRVAVLAVDPTSAMHGGSILGDKTRMTALANDPAAFVRPSPTQGELGGVTRVTRETILVVEAAGFDVVLVETVGVGQSETVVADMVDFFVVLMLSGAGDDLQGIKKGILEIADLIAVNKADGDNTDRAANAARDYQLALHMTQPASPTWTPPVITCSGLTGDRLEVLWDHVVTHRRLMSASGELDARRADQRVRWMRAMLTERMRSRLAAGVAGLLTDLEAQVRADELTPTAAVDRLMAAFDGSEASARHR